MSDKEKRLIKTLRALLEDYEFMRQNYNEDLQQDDWGPWEEDGSAVAARELLAELDADHVDPREG